MKSGFGYQLVQEQEIVLEYFTGVVTLEDIVFSEMQLFQNPDFVAKHTAIIDFRECELQLSKQDLEQIIGTIKDVYGEENNRKVVHIVSKPTETALAMIFSSLMGKDIHFDAMPEVVSTIEGACEVLAALSINKYQLAERLSTLKQHTLASLSKPVTQSNSGFACVIKES